MTDAAPFSLKSDFTSHSIKQQNWPALDRGLYAKALTAKSRRTSGKGLLQNLRPDTLETDAYGYGSWLNFLIQHNALDDRVLPADRISHVLIDLYDEALLAADVGDVSFAMYLSGTYRTLKVMHPERDWGWLCTLVEYARANAQPVVDKYGLPSIGELFRYGLDLIMNAERAGTLAPLLRAQVARNALMITLQACRPMMRIKNLQALTFSDHLIRDGKHYRLAFDHTDRKGKRSAGAPLPDILTPILDRYDRAHLPVLLKSAKLAPDVRHLWIAQSGRVLDQSTIRLIFGDLTEARFSRRIPPQQFRHAAATSYAYEVPEHFRDMRHVLDHATSAMSEQYIWIADHSKALTALDKSLCKIEGKR